MDQSVYNRRKHTNRIGLTLSMLAMVIGMSVLLWILALLFYKGFSALSWSFFTASTPAPGSEGGGLANAMVGSFMMIACCTLVSTPIGVLAGIYLTEYGDDSVVASITRFVSDIMLSAPSIVIGLFVYAILVAQVKHFSGWAGMLALSLIAIPVVLRTTENILRLVPGSLREAAFALGAPRWKVALMVTLRAGRSGVITGVLLALMSVPPVLLAAVWSQQPLLAAASVLLVMLGYVALYARLVRFHWCSPLVFLFFKPARIAAA